ncbi:Appr-1-p processing protein [bacterium]|nr:MAG: Appr-1-p processing protein [bacterium]
MNVEVVEGDLLDQDVEAIVNAWNRNIIPWWLLWPHGVSGAIKKRAGYAPFQQLPKRPIPLGDAVLTGAGRLPFKAIIHVAGINGLWRASEFSIRASVRNTVQLALQQGFKSLALPIIGAGAGSFSQDKALDFILDELKKLEGDLHIKVVKFRPPNSKNRQP